MAEVGRHKWKSSSLRSLFRQGDLELLPKPSKYGEATYVACTQVLAPRMEYESPLQGNLGKAQKVNAVQA